MTRSRALATLLMLSIAAPAYAQPAPFDMTPESGLRQAPAPAPDSAVPAVQPPANVPQPTPQPSRFERPLLPAATLRLGGEESREGVVAYLTEAQAAAPARLQFSYLNAIVVAPEISDLAIRINGAEVGRTPIASSAAPAQVGIDVPAGLLRAGANTIEFAASQRHRTDCSVNSTYELWTEIDGPSAILSFEGSALGVLRNLPDLAAVGVGADGRTTIRLVANDLDQPDARAAAMILAQQLVLALRVPNPHIELSAALSEAAQPGLIDVVVGPAVQLPAALSGFGAQAAAGPIAALTPLPSGVTTLLVSGPDWRAVSQASAAVLNAAPPAPTRPRIDLAQPVPMMLGGDSVSLAELGVPTIEFNGRRYSTRFQFELPPDFYANRYGEADLVLDAAYSADVQPGSEIDVYTNNQIASATPLLRTDGGLLRDTVIRIPMTNLRPGRNEVDVVVNLQTHSDEVCAPGWTGQAPVRFVFSSRSLIRLPNYARAATVPDLQVMTGSAWPYTDDAQVAMTVASGDDAAIAAMTFLARTAAASGRVVPVALTAETALAPGRNAIVVGPAPSLSAQSLGRAGLSATGLASGGTDDRLLLEQFRTDGSDGSAASTANRLLQSVGLSLDDLRVLPQRDPDYPVSAGTTVIAQSAQPEGGVWTFVTAPDGETLRQGVERLSATAQWRQIGGRVSALGPAGDTVTVVQSVAPRVIQTQPWSFFNLRRVAANWFSQNILAFTALMAGAAVLLMLATSMVLGNVGRQK